MTTEMLKRDVLAALTRVTAQEGGDVVSHGRVRDLTVEEDGTVRFSFFLSPDDPPSMVRDLRAAVETVPGVKGVKVNVQLPRAPQGGGGGARGRPLQPGSVPAPTPRPGLLPEVDRVVAVSSGKGGVGKSMVAANLATALAARGRRVGLLDADIYGPNIPLMFGENRRPGVAEGEGPERIAPLVAHGVRLMSLGFLLDKDQPAIMRGPLIAGILKQFLEQVAWGALDYLVVDMPPGTGDAQLSLVQTIDVDGVVMVTTPQDVATGDVRRGVRMFQRVHTPVLGIVENMSGFTCPHCGGEVEVFGKGGGEALARDLEVPFLGSVPLDPGVREAGDAGVPTVLRAPDSPAGKALMALAAKIEELLAEGGEG